MHQVKILLFFALLLMILVLRFFFFFHNHPTYHDGQHLSFETTLLSEPQIVGSKQRISANLASGNRVFITTSIYPQFHYADSLRIEGGLMERKLENGNIILALFYPKIEVVKNSPSAPPGTVWRLAPLRMFLAVPSFIRQKSIALFEKSLPYTSSSLLLGIVFGAKESLPKDFADSLRISGVFHVVAASGMNVTFVGGFLSSVFAWFLKRQIAILLSVAGICLYAVIAGLDPPIIRASIMGILVFTAMILGRQTLAAYGLFLSGFTMLMWSPSLIADIGFQLSFLATLGLLYIRPILPFSILGEGVATTIAAQVSTLPILLSNFGLYSLWSVVANGLVLWTIPALMVIGGLGALFGIIIPALGQLILYLSLPFLLYFEKIIMFFGKVGGVLQIEEFPWQIGVGYYLLVAAIVLFIKRTNNFRA